MKKLLALAGLLLLAACATNGTDSNADPFEARDPLKGFNKGVFAFNLHADSMVIKPVASAYHEIPSWGRTGVSNFLSNLSEPANMINGILQLNPDVALTAFWRFTLNTTFGIAGLRDFAKENGLKEKEQNFGNTLKVYGADDGAYVVLPLVGPSSVRDTTGRIVDWFIDPIGWWFTTPESIAEAAADGINTRDEQNAVVDQFYYKSLEPYVATRSAYLQHQAFHH